MPIRLGTSGASGLNLTTRAENSRAIGKCAEKCSLMESVTLFYLARAQRIALTSIEAN